MNKNNILITFIVAAIVVAAVCLYLRPKMDANPSTPGTSTSIIDTAWTWQKTVFADGKEIVPKDPSRFEIVFNADKTFSSSSDCNRMSGGYVADGEILSIGPVAMTKMFCNDAVHESEYAQELSRATSHVIEGDELRIKLLKDSGTMIFARAESAETKPAETIATSTPVNLNGSTFRLASYNGTAIPTSEKYTVTFESGKVSAKFCNGMGGEYTLKNGNIKANLIGTLMYCAEPANVMAYESAFGSIMANGTLAQSGSTLTLTGADGKQMVFNVFMD
ncbi:MAG TPA: META domain-containing protein [Candidatus Paceibacterota bacterium]